MMYCFVFIGALALLTFLSVLKLNMLTKDIEKFSNVRYLSYQAADELRQSSDDLTRLARTYVVTGDDKYEKMYLDILDIRNGKKPRPENYHQIYWDLVINYGEKPKADGEKIALNTIMKKLGFTDNEFSKLKEAKQNSDALVNMEVRAMNAIKGKFVDAQGNYSVIGDPDFETASTLLHSVEYHEEKAKIMVPIDAFFDLLESRTNEQFQGAMENAIQLLMISIGLMFLVGIAAIIGYILITRLVTTPVRNMSYALGKMDSTKDLQPRLETKGSVEIIEIANYVNRLIDGYSFTIANATEANKQVADVIDTINNLCDSNLTLSSQQNQELDMATNAITEMTNALESVSKSTSEAEGHAAQADDGASKGKLAIDSANQAVNALETNFQSTMSTIEQLADESSHVGNVLDVIKGIAEQTNLLALNAAIEAARAGEQGRGFAVVADEVRSLAHRTQESTGEIENMISRLQTQATQATSSIKESAKKITSTSEKIGHASAELVEIKSFATDIHKLNILIASETEQQLVVSAEISKNIGNVKILSVDINEKVLLAIVPLISEIHNFTSSMQAHAEEYKILKTF